MRLLHASRLQFEAFNEPNVPPYAVVSHRWGPPSDEITYQDAMLLMQPGAHPAASELISRSGYAKIAAACRQALRDSLEYVWIDTCCIDKSSSSELSEAINSMYNWYRNSELCYTYLADVPGVGLKGADSNARNPNFLQAFRKSAWFTRGWTLQELLAPHVVNFFAQDWTFLGTKHVASSASHMQHTSLARDISSITGIPQSILAYGDVHTASVAARMSWAARRNTTRLEDKAYCLLGLFDVNMPLLYGEGHKAFVRLQEAIMSTSDDQSLFAWRNVATKGAQRFSGFLAPSPDAFAEAGDIVRIRRGNTSEPYYMTHRGLHIHLALQRVASKRAVLAVLDCQYAKDPIRRLAIYVDQPWICEDDVFDFSAPQSAKLPSITTANQRVKLQAPRERHNQKGPIAGLVRDNLLQSPADVGLDDFGQNMTPRLLYIRQHLREADLIINDELRPPFFLRDMPYGHKSYFIMSQVYPANNWHPKTSTIQGDVLGRAVIWFKEIKSGTLGWTKNHVLLLRGFQDGKAWATFVTLQNAVMPNLNGASEALDKLWDRCTLPPYNKDIERAEYKVNIHFQRRACARVFIVDMFHRRDIPRVEPQRVSLKHSLLL